MNYTRILFWLAGVGLLLSSAFFLPLAAVAYLLGRDRVALLTLALVAAIPAAAFLSGLVIAAMAAVHSRR